MTEIIYTQAVVTKAASDGKGRVEMLASLDIIDRQDEVVEETAWAEDVKSFEPGIIPALVDHNPDLQAGTIVNAALDRGRLLTVAQLDLGSEVGTKTYEALLQSKSGDLPGVSVGFEPLEDKMVDGRRHITKARLVEVSILLTLAPANPAARVLSVLAWNGDEPRVMPEALLRELDELDAQERAQKHAAGARQVQAIHDAAVKYGAKCTPAETASKDSDEGKADDPTGKADDPETDALRARLVALEQERDELQ